MSAARAALNVAVAAISPTFLAQQIHEIASQTEWWNTSHTFPGSCNKICWDRGDTPKPTTMTNGESVDLALSALTLAIPGAGLEEGGLLAAEGAAEGGSLVIGKLADLGELGSGERTLLDRLPDLGNPQANWLQNSSVLRQEMQLGSPIRDATVDSAGNLINNTGFLRAERNLLDSHGWTYDPGTTLWSPPVP